MSTRRFRKPHLSKKLYSTATATVLPVAIQRVLQLIIISHRTPHFPKTEATEPRSLCFSGCNKRRRAKKTLADKATSTRRLRRSLKRRKGLTYGIVDTKVTKIPSISHLPFHIRILRAIKMLMLKHRANNCIFSFIFSIQDGALHYTTSETLSSL